MGGKYAYVSSLCLYPAVRQGLPNRRLSIDLVSLFYEFGNSVSRWRRELSFMGGYRET